MFGSDPFGDGYTESGFIAAAGERHAALRFTFRPPLVEEARRLRDAARQLTPDDYDRQAAVLTAAKIVDWDLADRPPITAATLLGLPPELFVRLHEIVLGWTSSDIDPDWPLATRERATEVMQAAKLSGSSVGKVREDRDEKNLILGVNLHLFHPQLLQRSCQSCQTWMYDDRHRPVLL